MNRTRATAIGAFSGAILLLLGVIAVLGLANSSHTVSVYKLNADVTAGQSYAAGIVDKVDVKGNAGEFNFTTTAPGNTLVFSQKMDKGDIVRDDDLVSSQDVAHITFTPETNVNFAGSDKLDIYVLKEEDGQTSSCIQLVGTKVPVVVNTGTSMTIQVQKADEAAWLAVTTVSGSRLIVASSGGSSPLSSQPVCVDDALRTLTGSH
jgi:hypothetical protein